MITEIKPKLEIRSNKKNKILLKVRSALKQIKNIFILKSPEIDSRKNQYRDFRDDITYLRDQRRF